MTTTFTHRILALLGTIALPIAAPVMAGPLRAGSGKVEITPDAADFPMHAAGEKDFVSIHDNMFARAIALDDGRHKLVLVNLEVTIVPNGADTIKAVAEALKLPPSEVLVFSSHTHSNPLVFYHGHDATPAQDRAIAKTRAGAIAAARAAIATLQPARMSFGQGKAYVNINNGELAGLKSWFDPAGPSNKALNVLEIQTHEGRPLALLVNYASHGEVMFRSVSKDGGYEASGDLPGATMRLLESSGASPVVLWSPGAEADQLPLFKSLQPAIGDLPAADEGANGWALVDVQARRLAVAVTDTLAHMGPATDQAEIATDVGSVSCPGKKLLIDHDNGKASSQPGEPVTIPLSFARINNIALAGIAGDVGSPIGSRLQAALPDRDSMVMTLMAGSIGYILPDEAYARPGHGVGSSSLAEGCAEHAIIDQFKRWDR